jgi:hypothetical protein
VRGSHCNKDLFRRGVHRLNSVESKS